MSGAKPDFFRLYPLLKSGAAQASERPGKYVNTIQGGHRVGVAGRVVCEQGNIHSFRNICSLNIRVARQKKGCASKLLPWLIQGDSIYNTLILSPPGAGKTTICDRLRMHGSQNFTAAKERLLHRLTVLTAAQLVYRYNLRRHAAQKHHHPQIFRTGVQNIRALPQIILRNSKKARRNLAALIQSAKTCGTQLYMEGS